MDLPGPFGLTAWLLVLVVVVAVTGVLVDLGLWPGSIPRTDKRDGQRPPPPH